VGEGHHHLVVAKMISSW